MSTSFFRDHAAGLTTLALWPPVTMGVASLLRRRQTAAAEATAAATASSTASRATIRPYRQPAGVEVVVVESTAEWDKVWAKIQNHIQVNA